ncbi:MAG TPA: acetate--CoA ligase family protein [Anaerolineales bacterium]|jgi:acetyltransferase|nr:acetate--CoA ligase family protein [Anaerolineales bacterium]
MREIFYPSSVVVIGVSDRPDNLGRNIVGNLIEYGFNGIVYAVGPRGGMIETRRIYHSVADIPDSVDLAVIITPARTVPGILEQCGHKGIRWAIIETAGFREFGDEGEKLEQEMVRIADQYGIRFVGPNCIGAISMENGFCVPFPRLKKYIKNGKVSMISQSGGVGLSVLNLMSNEGVGLNKFVSVGNMLNIDAEDMLEMMIDDDGTELIFLYLESIRDGRRLMDVAKRSTKPILAFKSNIGNLGNSIALSHTASLTSDDKVVDAAFDQAGIIRIHDATTLGNNMKILELPPMKGRNLAIISRSGGHAVIAADTCELSGFKLAELPETFLREIEKHFRASVINLTNPLDLGDLFDLKVYAQIVEQTLQLDSVDGVVFLHTSSSGTENEASRELLDYIIDMVKKYNKPVAYYISTLAEEVNYLKQNYDFPIFTQVVETIRALEINHAYANIADRLTVELDIPQFSVDTSRVQELIDTARNQKRDLLLSEAIEVLDVYGIPTVKSLVANTVDQAQAAAEQIGYPVAIKIIADQISHKSDVGGVQLNLRTPGAVTHAFKDMMSRIRKAYPKEKLDGVLVQPMVTGGQELILGGRQDPQFGPVVVAGLGGIFVEIFGETSVRVAPISRDDAEKMILSLRGSPILLGARGRRPSDVDSVVESLLKLSQLLRDFPEIEELDINPLRVLHKGEGCLALDARMILAK